MEPTNHPFRRKMIFQTSMIMVHVNLPGCTHPESSGDCDLGLCVFVLLATPGVVLRSDALVGSAEHVRALALGGKECSRDLYGYGRSNLMAING